MGEPEVLQFPPGMPQQRILRSWVYQPDLQKLNPFFPPDSLNNAISSLNFPVFITSLIALLYYLGLQEQPATSNLATPLIFNFVSWIIIGLLVKAWDKTTEKIVEREQQYHRTAVEIASDLLNKGKINISFDFVDVKKESIKNIIYKQINTTVDGLITEYAVEPFDEKYKDIRGISQNLDELSIKYLDAVKTLTTSFDEYYSNTDINLSALEKVSSAIRTEAIEPSFEMLQERDSKLNEVYKNLVEVSIMMSK